ncbi:MAG: hypothetical protein ABSH20_06585 [Tepidisphaeraceae bacterium]|jgi:hypothetical protein
MTQLPPPRRPDQPAYQLDYASPEANRPAGGVGFAGQVALGFAAFVAAVIAGIVVTAVIASATNGADASFLVGPVIALASLLLLTITANRRWQWKGFLIGVLGSLGLLFLAFGLCFAAFHR